MWQNYPIQRYFFIRQKDLENFGRLRGEINYVVMTLIMVIYESKFIPESPYWTQIKYKEAEGLKENQKKKLYRNAEVLFERCKCR